MRNGVLLLMVLGLLGCQSAPKVGNFEVELSDYTWHLVSLQNRSATEVESRTQLFFDGTQLSVTGLCNSLSGRATFSGEHIRIGQLVSTMMACNNQELMAHERFMGTWLPDADTWSLQDATPDYPLLTLTHDSGSSILLRGEPTPEKRFGSRGETLFLEIQPQRVTCHHPLMTHHTCLQVREVHYDERGIKTQAGDWELFYTSIENYQHDESVRVILRVKRYALAYPPADGLAYAYVYDMTVEQERVTP